MITKSERPDSTNAAPMGALLGPNRIMPRVKIHLTVSKANFDLYFNPNTYLKAANNRLNVKEGEKEVRFPF